MSVSLGSMMLLLNRLAPSHRPGSQLALPVLLLGS
jgi:hypothetical protein